MDQDPTSSPPSGDGKPGFFNKVNGTIAGVTGLVIALGGLAATWDRIFPNDQAQAAAPVETAAEAVPPDETATATEEAVPEAGDPTLYKGEKLDSDKALSLEWNGKNWILTEGNDTYSYDDLTPTEDGTYEAVSNGNYLRWPIAGGEVDESENRQKWSTYGTVKPVAE